jgi:predicted ester cyclase
MRDAQTLALTCLAAINGLEKRPDVLERYISDVTLRERILATEAALPRSQLVCRVAAAVSDTVVLVGHLRGRHQGDFLGVAATYRMLDVPAVMILGFEGEKIARHWVSIDATEAYAQMGVDVAPGARARGDRGPSALGRLRFAGAPDWSDTPACRSN